MVLNRGKKRILTAKILPTKGIKSAELSQSQQMIYLDLALITEES